MTRPLGTVLLAAALAAGSATSFAQDPAVAPTPDEIQRTLRAQPADAAACLATANRCWDPSMAQPLFECWAATASREDLIRQAASAGWTVRGLALRALTQAPTSPIHALRASPGSAPILEWSVSRTLVGSLVQLLSQDVSRVPAPNTISHETARLARDALWELSDGNMTVALESADHITLLNGRDLSAGRFGASYDLATRDPRGYAVRRRAWQLLAAGALAVLFAALRAVRGVRDVATALLAGVFIWGAWFSFHTDVRELPPPRLMFLTASCLAFLSAGLVSGLTLRLRIPAWQQVAVAALAAAACAFLLCTFTRTAGWFPVGDGARLIFEPGGSALLAAVSAVAIALGLKLETSGDAFPTSGAGAAGPQPSPRS